MHLTVYNGFGHRPLPCQLLLVFLLSLPAIILGCSPLPERSAADRAAALDLIDVGTMQLEEGHVDQARASFEIAFERFPLTAALDGLGCVALYMDQLKLARKYFDLAYTSDPAYYRVLGHLALVAELEGDREEADRLYRESLFYEPENIRVRNNYAAFLFDQVSANRNRSTVETELLRANSITPHPIIRSNFKKLRGEYGRKKKTNR